jgi:hypothetical protein
MRELNTRAGCNVLRGRIAFAALAVVVLSAGTLASAGLSYAEDRTTGSIGNAPGQQAGGRLIAPMNLATGGSGKYRQIIDWIQWGDASNQTVLADGTSSKTVTSTRDVGGQILRVACTASGLQWNPSIGTGANGANTGETRRPPLVAYTPGGWTGDALDNLYNDGGQSYAVNGPLAGGAYPRDESNSWYTHKSNLPVYPRDYRNPNKMVIGLGNPQGDSSNGANMSFDFSCQATLNGVTVPLEGLVFADAEASSSANTSSSETFNGPEWVEARPTATNPGQTVTWRIIENARSCTQANATASWPQANTLRLGVQGQECAYQPTTSYSWPQPNPTAYGPMAIAFMQGATSAKVGLQGRGYSAVALGYVLSTDFGDAPESYGEAGALFQNQWTGSPVPTTGTTDVSRTGILSTVSDTATTPILGSRISAESNARHSADATGDDSAASDDDAIDPSSVRLPIALRPGAQFQVPNIECTQAPGNNPAGHITGWIDWNGNGVFDSGESSNTVTCPAGTATATLTFTIPSNVDTTLTTTFMRLRIATTAADSQRPTGVTIGGEVEDHQLARAQGLLCNATDYYTVRSNGTLYKGTVASTSTTQVTGQWTAPSGSGSNAVHNWTVNGLGIVEGGSEAYAFGRYTRGSSADDTSRQYVGVLKYDAATGSFTSVGSQLQVNTTANGNAYYGRMVAGAVDPISGNYYFGGYGYNSGNDSRFRVYEFDIGTAQISYIGYIQPTGVGTDDSGNGDIGFDRNGNLFLIYSTTTGTNKIVPVSSADLQAAAGGRIPAAQTQPTIEGQASLQYNGISFLSNGRIVVQASSASGTPQTIVWTADPNTWALSNQTVIFGASAQPGTDLATCTYPPTIEVKKNVVSRAATGDQFTMQVRRTDLETTLLAEATTAGSATGVQPQVAGPVVARSGSGYRITETGANGADLANYTTTWQCTALQVLPGWPISGTGTTIDIASFPVPLPDDTSGPNVTCTFTNGPKPASVVIKKRVTDATGITAPATGWTVDAVLSGQTGGTVARSPNAHQPTAGADASAAWDLRFTSFATRTTVNVSETQQAGHRFVSGSCTVTPLMGSPRTVPLTGEGATALTGIAAGDRVECTYINELVGSVRWEKVDGATPAVHLNGSEWKIAGPDPATDEKPVTDCVGTSAADVDACNGFEDKDPRAGHFEVRNLAQGTYRLVETKAPAGYQRDSSPHSFTVGNGNLNPSLAPIVNRQQDVPSIPLTGGVGRDSFTIAGLTLALLGLATVIAVRLRKRREAN